MRNIKLGHWAINGNTMHISLMNFYVTVTQVPEGILVNVIDSDNKSFKRKFQYLESAFIYVEEYVNYCHDIEEVSRIGSVSANTNEQHHM